MNKLGIILAIAILFLAGGYTVVHTMAEMDHQDDPKPWQKYSNEEYKFSLEYPNGWTFQETLGGPLTPFGVQFANVDFDMWHGEAGDYPDQFVSIAFYKDANISLEDYAKQDIEGKQVVTKTEEKVVDGERGLIQTSVLKNKKTDRAVYLKREQYIVIIETMASPENTDVALDSFNQILNTITFKR